MEFIYKFSPDFFENSHNIIPHQVRDLTNRERKYKIDKILKNVQDNDFIIVNKNSYINPIIFYWTEKVFYIILLNEQALVAEVVDALDLKSN